MSFLIKKKYVKGHSNIRVILTIQLLIHENKIDHKINMDGICAKKNCSFFLCSWRTDRSKDSESSHTEIGIVLFQMYNSQHWHSSQM